MKKDAGGKDEEAALLARKAKQSRKSSAYHKAYKNAIKDGLSPVEAKEEGKKVT